MYALGRHLIIELKDCSHDKISSLNIVKTILVEAAKKSKATIVDVSFHEFNPFGISGVVIIAESHLSIHTWPEYNYAAADIFTCGDTIDPDVAARFLIEEFECKTPLVTEIKRGIISMENKILPFKQI